MPPSLEGCAHTSRQHTACRYELPTPSVSTLNGPAPTPLSLGKPPSYDNHVRSPRGACPRLRRHFLLSLRASRLSSFALGEKVTSSPYPLMYAYFLPTSGVYADASTPTLPPREERGRFPTPGGFVTYMYVSFPSTSEGSANASTPALPRR